jgi:ADP-heptose:LPS heptosyltransferase
MISMGAGVIRHRVGIYPGARKPDHRIEPDVFSGIARGLGENGCEVMIIPGLDNREICLEIAEKSGARLAAVAQGESICSLIGSMDLMICNNTGPMHLSVAMGVPTLGLFIATDPVRWGHNTEPHLTIDFRRARPEAGFINQTALQMVNKPLW